VLRIFARLTGLVVLLYGAWMFTINLFEAVTDSNTYEPPWMLLVVLGFGASGAVGGTLFLLSIDGPSRFRKPMIRAIGWIGMFICSALPTSLFYVLLIMVAISAVILLRPIEQVPEETSLSSG
jgi:hypothetical protein